MFYQKAGKISHNFYVYLYLFSLYIVHIIFMPSLKAEPTEDQAERQSNACLPVLRRDIVSSANRWKNHSDGFKNVIFLVVLPAIDHSLITPFETHRRDQR